VRDVALGLAAQNYGELMSSSNFVFAEWKRQHPGMPDRALEKAFVSKFWGKYVPAARAILTKMLSEPIDEALKEEIVEALVLDSTLIRGRINPAIVAGEVRGPGQGN
jgi:hypothetical protein